jgi:hypothetical protein
MTIVDLVMHIKGVFFVKSTPLGAQQFKLPADGRRNFSSAAPESLISAGLRFDRFAHKVLNSRQEYEEEENLVPFKC